MSSIDDEFPFLLDSIETKNALRHVQDAWAVSIPLRFDWNCEQERVKIVREKLFPFLLDSIETTYLCFLEHMEEWFPFLLDSIETERDSTLSAACEPVSIPLRFDWNYVSFKDLFLQSSFPFLLDSIETGHAKPAVETQAKFPFLLDSIETW